LIQLKELYIFMGPPGSGKGTLSQLCIDKLGWKQISTGNLCRKHIAEGTEIGKAIDFAIKSGKLVSDDLITQMVIDWFEYSYDQSKPVILDGYPRTEAQARVFDKFLREKLIHLQVTLVLFDIDDEEVVKRLSARSVCSNKECQAVYSLLLHSPMRPKKDGICDLCGSSLMCRSDDQPESIRVRLATYAHHAKMLDSYYESTGQRVIRFNAQQPIDQLFGNFMQLIGRTVE
jgi:adenylate kinase